MSQSKLLELTYYDPKANVRLTTYADTIITEPNGKTETIAAVRFGGYPEMVRAMSDAIYGGGAIDLIQNGNTFQLKSTPKSYQQQTLTASVQPQFQVLTDVPDFRKGLETVISFDPDGKVGLLFDGQRLTFQCRSKLGSSTASIGVIPLRGSARGEYWFLTSNLEACFHALTGSVKLGVAAGGMLVLETEDALYLQTATRAPVIQAEEKKKAPAKKAA